MGDSALFSGAEPETTVELAFPDNGVPVDPDQQTLSSDSPPPAMPLQGDAGGAAESSTGRKPRLAPAMKRPPVNRRPAPNPSDSTKPAPSSSQASAPAASSPSGPTTSSGTASQTASAPSRQPGQATPSSAKKPPAITTPSLESPRAGSPDPAELRGEPGHGHSGTATKSLTLSFIVAKRSIHEPSPEDIAWAVQKLCHDGSFCDVEGLVLEWDKDHFLQAAHWADGRFVLEYDEDGVQFFSVNKESPETVIMLMQSYARGDFLWRTAIEWS